AAVEDVYPLSPLQQGFLFHTLATPESGLYVEQMSATVVGDVQPHLLEHAWQSAIDRHSVLRTAFLWENLDRPLQKVAPKVEFHMKVEDWRDLDPAAQQARFEEEKRADKRQSFDLSREPLMRVQLFQTAEREHLLLWTHHHLLMDGWSAPLMIVEVFAAYDALLHGKEPSLPMPRPFRDYIAWLLAQDLSGTEEYWRRTLRGFTRATPLASDRPAPAAAPGPEDHDRRDLVVLEEATTALQSFARHNQLTLNNVAQAMWALLLGRASGERDVLYGTSISSRPAELAGIESLVGLFLNALPVRVRLPFEEPVATWLKGLQDLQRELLANSHTPLVEIQGWSEVPRDQPMFVSVYEFWNFPAAVDDRPAFQIREGRYDIATNYPLSLRIVPEQTQISLQLTYDRRRFDAATIDRMLRELQLAFTVVVQQPQATLAELSAVLDEALRSEREEKAKEMSGIAREKLKSRVRRPATEAQE
ncbi:MAG TPA: condensation domain-containing protein, partial [Thermoanaerobaculia bacterium]